MSGLSYLQDGGQPEQQTDTTVQVKPSAGKGKYALPALTGNIPVQTEGVLSSMEELYRQKMAEQAGFMEAMKDAAAWWSGDLAGPGAALSRRSKEREEQSANLFQLQTQIAQYKAAQADQAKFEKEKPALLGAANSSLADAGFDLLPHEIALLQRATTRADFNKLLQKFGEERTKSLTSAEAGKPSFDVLMKDDEGNFTIPNQVSLSKRNELIRKGEGIEPGTAAPKPAAAPAPAAPAPAAPAPAAPAPAAPAPAAPAPAAPAPAARPVNYTFNELTPQQLDIFRAKSDKEGLLRNVADLPDMAAAFDRQPLEKRKAVFSALGPDESVQPETMTDVTEGIGPITKPTPVAQAAAPTPAKRPPTLPEIRAQQELEKQRAGERAKTEADQEKEHNTAAGTAIDRERTASEIIKIVSQNPEVTGVLQKPGVAAALGTLLQTGISAPGGHSIGVRELDEVLFKGQKNLTQEQVNARDRLRSLLNKTALNAASVMKGQGAVTEFERQLLQNMVGSLQNTPENLIKIQKALMENAIARRNIDKEFKASKMAWGDFVKTEKYAQIQEKYDEKLRAIEEEKISFGKTKGAASVEQKPFTKEEEAAYKKWKEEQIKKRQQGK